MLEAFSSFLRILGHGRQHKAGRPSRPFRWEVSLGIERLEGRQLLDGGSRESTLE